MALMSIWLLVLVFPKYQFYKYCEKRLVNTVSSFVSGLTELEVTALGVTAIRYIRHVNRFITCYGLFLYNHLTR